MGRAREDVVTAINSAAASGSANPINLSGWDLQGTDLSGLNLHKVNLSGANLKGANLSATYLREADFSGADLREANLSAAYLYRAKLTRSNLENTNFNYADLYKADLRNVSHFNGAQFNHAILLGTFLGQADLRETDIDRAIFRSSHLSQEVRAIIEGPTHSSFLYSDLYATFEHARFPNGFWPRQRLLEFPEDTTSRESIARLSRFSPQSVDAAFPLPDFFEVLTEQQQKSFIEKRDQLICCPISLEPIETPVTIGNENQHYNCEHLKENLTQGNYLSPCTRKRVIAKDLNNCYSPDLLKDYADLIDRTKPPEASPHTNKSGQLKKQNFAKKSLGSRPFIHIVDYIILEKYNICHSRNIEKAFNDPRKFYQSYLNLKSISLDSAFYLQAILDNTDALDRIVEHKDIFLTLHSLGLDKKEHLQALLKHPKQSTLIKIILVSGLEQVIESCKARGNIAKLNMAELFKLDVEAINDDEEAEAELLGAVGGVVTKDEAETTKLDKFKTVLKNAACVFCKKSGWLPAKSYLVAQPYFEAARGLLDISSLDWQQATSQESTPTPEGETLQYYNAYLSSANNEGQRQLNSNPQP
ncbi:pentapeptide repeat-containing protein [Piscirickettsia salmonis]|uniref:pentapeptide repeat-containing protein n=1 Tax=Piscirickettsia salmonis TaxID=1238 RepID=UPI0007C960DE|nr:Secreted effector protein pipB2 [Piscirickettsiaceae bacterium NZ-RLO1]